MPAGFDPFFKLQATNCIGHFVIVSFHGLDQMWKDKKGYGMQLQGEVTGRKYLKRPALR